MSKQAELLQELLYRGGWVRTWITPVKPETQTP